MRCQHQQGGARSEAQGDGMVAGITPAGNHRDVQTQHLLDTGAAVSTASR